MVCLRMGSVIYLRNYGKWDWPTFYVVEKLPKIFSQIHRRWRYNFWWWWWWGQPTTHIQWKFLSIFSSNFLFISTQIFLWQNNQWNWHMNTTFSVVILISLDGKQSGAHRKFPDHFYKDFLFICVRTFVCWTNRTIFSKQLARRAFVIDDLSV